MRANTEFKGRRANRLGVVQVIGVPKRATEAQKNEYRDAGAVSKFLAVA